MRIRRTLLAMLVALVGVALLATPAAAHRIRIWAVVAADGAIRGEVFSPGSRMAGATVRICDASDRLLAEVQTDAQGQFEYRPTSRQDHVLRVDLGDGHAAEAHIAAEAFEVAPRTADEPMPHGSAPDSASPSAGHTGTVLLDAASGISSLPAERLLSDLDELRLKRLENQLFELRREIAASQERMQIRDLIGGVG